MCVYSMIVDHQWDEWNEKYGPWKKSQLPPVSPQPPGSPTYIPYPALPTQEEIDRFRKLLERAEEYDKRNNEPDCEMESKKQKLMDLAKELGIEDKINFL